MSAPAASRAGAIGAWLARARTGPFLLYAVGASFATYFCMYGYRKAFAAARFEGEAFALPGGELSLKAALVVSQVLGYMASKYAGVRLITEVSPSGRAPMLLGCIALAEGALVLFAVVPPEWQLLAMLLNGLALGGVWGLVYGFLEGRRTSEILGAGLCSSFILASGVARSVGATLLDRGVSESWMPAATGLLYLPAFLGSVWLLNQLPPPDREDVVQRVQRAPMTRRERVSFLRNFLGGLVLLITFYVLLTAYRDFRDFFVADIFRELSAQAEAELRPAIEAARGSDPERAVRLRSELEAAQATYSDPAVFARIEVPVAFAVLGGMALLYLIRDNRRAFFATHALMGAGTVLAGASTLLFDAGVIDGVWWMGLVGLGLYLAYVPYNCILFDRMVAAMGTVATAVFTIYVADALGYTGSVGVILYKNFGRGDLAHLDFFRRLSYLLTALAVVCFAGSALYFARKRPAGAPARRGAGVAGD